MSRTLSLAFIPLFVALFAGCGDSPPPEPKSAQSCQPGFFWNGKECEKQRTILLDQSKAPPPPPAPTSSSSP